MTLFGPEGLLLHSIFRSVSGEVGLIPQGAFTTFVRLSGCNLRCKYCDTERAQGQAQTARTTYSYIYKQVQKLRCPNVIITGGEPLDQRGTHLGNLIELLKGGGYRVQIETNGSFRLYTNQSGRGDTDPHCWVVDYKLPGSGEEGNMIAPEWFVSAQVELTVVKFVCTDKTDFDRAQAVSLQIQTAWLRRGLAKRRTERLEFAYSAAKPLEPRTLIEWLEEQGNFSPIINLQIHKTIWPDGEDEGI